MFSTALMLPLDKRLNYVQVDRKIGFVNSPILSTTWRYCVRIDQTRLALPADLVVDVHPCDFNFDADVLVDFITADGEVIFIGAPALLLKDHPSLAAATSATAVLVLKVQGARVGLRVSEYFPAVAIDSADEVVHAHGHGWQVADIKDSLS